MRNDLTPHQAHLPAPRPLGDLRGDAGDPHIAIADQLDQLGYVDYPEVLQEGDLTVLTHVLPRRIISE